MLEESLAIGQRLGDSAIVAASLSYLGWATCLAGDRARALPLLEEGLALYRQVGHQLGISFALHSLGMLVLLGGDDERAAGLLEGCLSLAGELGFMHFIIAGLRGLGMVAGVRGHASRAACLFGAAAALQGDTRSPQSPITVAYERQLASTRAALGEVAWGAAWAAGRAMTPAEAIAFALGDTLSDR